MVDEEYFGSDDQKALLRRGQRMADFVGDDVRFSYYGRTVGLIAPEDGDLEQFAGLVGVQGSGSYAAVPKGDAVAMIDALEKRGLAAVNYTKWEGQESALNAARAVVDSFPLPGDLTLVRVDANTPHNQMNAFAAMALSCGVLPLSGAVMRGLLRPAVCMFAMDKAGKVVSCAASAAFAQAAHPTLGAQAWWGMLATDPSRRGERLALILGAQVMLDMYARYGIADFMTGIEHGNVASEAVCARMGLAPGKHVIVSCVDPNAVPSGRMTK